MLLEISHNSQENTRARAFFLNKVAGLRPEACNFIKKETLAQVFFREFSEISKNTFSYKTPLVAASVYTARSWPGLIISCLSLDSKS